MFGVYHPAYLKALQNFVSFSNEFRQDLFGVEAAAACVSIAAKLYNSDNLRVVFALQSKSLSYCKLCDWIHWPSHYIIIMT